MQFEESDLLVKLGHDSYDWLIIHSGIFAAVPLVFRANGSVAWEGLERLDDSKHPMTLEDVAVRTLALRVVDDTFNLEGKVRALRPWL
jgi:hypothetical protein